jgi:uncharacterized protein (TIGR03790 family)
VLPVVFNKDTSERIRRIRVVLLSFALLFSPANKCLAGGSGLNLVVVANQRSTNSILLANHYSEARQIPPENTLKIDWGGGNTIWTEAEFQTTLLYPLINAINQRGLSNQIDTVVLSMDIPFQTIQQVTNINSTTSALYYGMKVDGGNDVTATNSFAFSETSFVQNRPASAKTNSFLAVMLTSDSLQPAKRLVDQGVSSDGTFPQQPALLAKTSDTSRNIRHVSFDNAIYNVDLRGNSSLIRTNANSPFGNTNLLGYQTGLANYSVSPDSFLPGAMADSFTSFGGKIFGANDQTSLLAFINAGAAGSYGTVSEPLADAQKFPDPMVYFYQSRGFNIAESYYQSVNIPYLGLIVAEPLASPFALAGSGKWAMGISNAVLTGSTPLSVQFTAHDATRPLQRVDLFVDGKHYRTLTNLVPLAGNQIDISLNGYPLAYSVATNETLASIASGLASLINDSTNQNQTRIKALARGDRIELQSTATNHQSFPYFISLPGPSSSISNISRVSYLPETHPPRLMTSGKDKSGNFAIRVEIPTPLNYVVQASTNLFDWLNIATNATPGLFDFSDTNSSHFPNRFYRVAGPTPYVPPKITFPVITNGGVFRMRVESQPGQPCTVLCSPDQIGWVPMVTNLFGGTFDFVDDSAASASRRFYRAWVTPPASAAFTVLTNAVSTLIRVDSAVRPYTVEVITNGSNWTTLATNFLFRDIQISASSSQGNASNHTTFVREARSQFMLTSANGNQQIRISKSSALAVGDYLQCTITKTNGQVVIVSATNQTAGANYTNLVLQVINLINAHPLTQGSDGVIAEDYLPPSPFVTFALRARTVGYTASGIGIGLTKKGTGWMIIPAYGQLRGNLSDLQPRNHLYVTVGASKLNASFDLDTTQLPDGHHELTAVAYEGSSVRTQTRTTIPVRVQNTSLTATMTLTGLTNNAPAIGTYPIQVAANTNDISSITLFSTAGQIGIQTNISVANFTVFGTNLQAGLHPFYAVIEAATGEKYRTQTEWVRLAP